MVTFTSSSFDVVLGNLPDASSFVQFMLFVAIMLGGVGGLVVAAILKKLDNIVKEYSGATANMFTAIFCSFLFPEKFSFTIYIFLAMVLLFGGIYLYETQKVVARPAAPLNNSSVGQQEDGEKGKGKGP